MTHEKTPVVGTKARRHQTAEMPILLLSGAVGEAAVTPATTKTKTMPTR